MPYAIADRLSLSVFIEGQELPFSDVFTFNYIHLSCGTKQALPYFVISVTDSIKWLFMSSLLKDGNRVKIVAQSGSIEVSNDYTFEFRLSSFNEKAHTNGSIFTLEGYLDVPKFINTSSRTPLKATSSEVLKQLAELVGLTFEGVGTNDSQVWYPMNRRLFEYARYIANAGFATDNSAMLLAVDLGKTMIYRDITSMDAPKYTLGLMNFDAGHVIPVVAVQPSISSGSLNQIAGYTMTTIEQDLEAATIHLKNVAVGTTINEEGDLLVNSDLKSSGREGRVAFGMVDAGNAHENFIRARHQNRRVLSLFSFALAVVIPTITEIKVLDTVNLETSQVSSEDSGSSITYAGLYRVIHKVIYGQPGQLVEKLVLVRRTITTPDSGSNSIGGLENSLIVSSQEQLSRISDLPFSIDSKLDVPGFNIEGMTATVAALGSMGVSAINGAATSAVSGAANASAAMDDAPPVTPLLDALIDDINDERDATIDLIEADLALDPNDLDNSLPALVATGKADINALIAAQTPAIANAAAKVIPICTGAKGVADSISGASGSFTKSKDTQTRAMNAISALAPPGTMVTAIATQTAALNSSVTNAETTISEGAGDTAAQADELLVDATTYTAQINAAKTAAFAAIDAAAVHP